MIASSSYGVTDCFSFQPNVMCDTSERDGEAPAESDVNASAEAPKSDGDAPAEALKRDGEDLKRFTNFMFGIEDAKDKEERERREEEEQANRIEQIRHENEEAVAAGKTAFARGEFDEAERCFDVALSSKFVENRAEVVCNRAACALKADRFDDALGDAVEATTLEPSYVKGHYRTALAHRGMGRPDRALAAARRALALQPASAQLGMLVDDLQAECEKAQFDPEYLRQLGAVLAPPAAVDDKGLLAAARDATRTETVLSHERCREPDRS